MEGVEEKYERYRRMTRSALEKVEILPPKGSEFYRIGELLVDMARRYLRDGEYFAQKGDYATALASVSYAHAWLDVGVVMGILKGEDPKLFMVEP